LAAEHTSFRSLAEECRKARAQDLLATPGLAVEEVAARLGYSEAAAFTHAFKRWTGEAPQAYRARRLRLPPERR
jgi:AraC-like DNA-binding protein